MPKVTKTGARRPRGAAQRVRAGREAARPQTEIMALKLRPAPLSPPMAAFFKSCEDKLGFVPNVMQAFSFDMTKLEAFVAYRNDLMLGDSGLSTLEREMIATVVSAQNRCFYCITVHGAAVRLLADDPVLGEMMAMNYRAAPLSPRRRAMLDFAVKLTIEPWSIEESDRAAPARRRLLGSRHLGHRGRCGLLQHDQPPRLRRRHAAEQRISRQGEVRI